MASPAAARPVGLRALLPYLRAHRGTLAAVAILSVLAAASSLAQPLLVRAVLDGITTARPVAGAVSLLVGVLLVGASLDALRAFLLQRTAEGLVLTTRRRLTGHLLRLPIAEYDRRRRGDLLSRVGADTTLLRAVVTSGLFEIVAGAVMAVGAIIAMALLDPVLLAVDLVALTVGISVAVTVARRIRGLSEQAQARIGDMTSAVDRAISAARTIRAAGAERREVAAVDMSATAAYRAGVRVARLRAAVAPAVTMATQGAFLLVLAAGGARVAAGVITVGDLVAFILFLFLLVVPLGSALNAYTQLQTGLGAVSRIEEVLELPAESDQDRPARTTSRSARVANREAVAFDNVTFSYSDGPVVLRDVSFRVPTGTRTALVGPSGAGKSTILALIERFYDVSAGAVRVDGSDVRDVSRHELRRRLGYVEQDSPALVGTLRDNLLLTAPDADDDRLLDALAEVNLAGLASRTPLGLDAEVGEGGVLLSGGERQRLAIARALLGDPPILLLDEPTSNVDARNEAALRTAIRAAADRRTLLVVAHRLSTVRDSDQIVVLDAGRVVAVGDHDALLEASPLYRELAAHQFLVPERAPERAPGGGTRELGVAREVR